MANNDDLDTGSYAAAGSDWAADENFWRRSYASRPYASSDRSFDFYRSAFRYGHDSGRHHRGRQWSEVEPELRTGWQKFEAKGESAWENVKGAVRDAWDRVSGH